MIRQGMVIGYGSVQYCATATCPIDLQVLNMLYRVIESLEDFNAISAKNQFYLLVNFVENISEKFFLFFTHLSRYIY